MTRPQFWIVTCGAALVGLLLLTQVLLARQLRKDDHTLVNLQRIAQEGNAYTSRWQQLAVRVYQLSQQDAGLKELLVRQKINIAPNPAANPPSASASSPSPATPSPAK